MFVKFDIWGFFSPKNCREISSFVKTHKNNEYFILTHVHLWYYLAEFFLQWKMFQTKRVQKIRTHISCSATFSESRLWQCGKSFVEPDRAQMAIYHGAEKMRFACQVIKHAQYLLLFHGNNCYANALQYYVIRTLPVFATIWRSH